MSKTPRWFNKAPSWFVASVEKEVKTNAPEWFLETVLNEQEINEEEEERVRQTAPLMQNKVSGDGSFEGALLGTIRKGEAGRWGYDAWYGRGTSVGPVAPPKPPTQMTINEVLEWQNVANPAGPATTAIGAYQFVDQPNARTLSGLKTELGLSGDELFTPELQDRLAMHLLKRRGLDKFKSGRLTWDQFANELAKEWAALPVVAPTRRGKISLEPGMSYYSGVGGNKAQIAIGEFKSVFELAEVEMDVEQMKGTG